MVLNIYKETFPGVPFYKEYNSFTQDFLTDYEKRFGRIRGMVREPRGNLGYINENGETSDVQVMTGTRLLVGCGNKIIAIEKAGLWRAMVENRFDIKLDAILLSTQGFSTEAGRDVLRQAYDTGLPVCVLHDYDINGILIHSTLQKPTKRRNIYIPKVIDLGLTWEVISDLMEKGEISPESTRLSKQDTNKLNGMYDRDEITIDEFEFLHDSRVELNALTPLALLQWLEERLEELDLWKTIPKDQDELDAHLQYRIDDNLGELNDSIQERLAKGVMRELKMDILQDYLDKLESAVESFVDNYVGETWEETIYDGFDLDEFIARLRKDMFQFWKRLADTVGDEISKGQEDDVRSYYLDDAEDFLTGSLTSEVLTHALDTLTEDLRNWISGMTTS